MMDILLTLLAAVIIFSVLVLVHEVGHFVVARRQGIKVVEFGFGFPPRLWGKKHKGVLYSINAIPFGGFVRMHGEDSRDAKLLKSRNSFIAKTPWQRTKVIVAGVAMNFLLAIVLLTVGFTFGIEPLIVSGDDLVANVRQGNVVLQESVLIDSVKKDSQASELGLRAGDRILALNDKSIQTQQQLVPILEKDARTEDVDIRVVRNGEVRDVHFIAETRENQWGITLKPLTLLPRMTFLEVPAGSPFAEAGFLAGDRILQANGHDIFSRDDWLAVLGQSSELAVTVLRGDERHVIGMPAPLQQVVIAEIFPDTPAENAGLRSGDIIQTLNREAVFSPERVSEMIRDAHGDRVGLEIRRGEETLPVTVTPGEDGLLGISIVPLQRLNNYIPSFYETFAVTSLAEIKNVRYPVHRAFLNSLSETKRLTGITAGAFGRTIRDLVTKQEVPEEVGGPVRIAVYTHVFVKEGFFALLRFTALLSISLGVINIVPIPALDGGRLLFVIIEVLRGKRVSQRFEAAAHNLGFAILIFLVLLITYNDILNIF